jgi:NAD(P)-dependent dehydrogenase (short-subunit alcohol dehydrogenase family)
MTTMEKWTAERIPDQSGRLAIVTGANSGLGEVTAHELARAGARVVLACRSLQKGEVARRAIETPVPGAQLELEELDLASLDSVRAFAERFRGVHERLDLLINNAGVMATPRRRTADGFELQFGTNHFGHFALTGLLVGTMKGRDDARVITLSSSPAYRMGRIAFDNLGGERRYFRWRAYAQSKLANLLFMLELDRGLHHQEPGRAPRLRGHEPAVRRAAACGPPRDARPQRGRRAERRHGCAVHALRRH